MWTLVAPFWGRASTMEALVWTLVALRAVECPRFARPRNARLSPGHVWTLAARYVDSRRANSGLSRGLWSHTQIARKIVPQIASAIRVQIDAVDCLCSRSCSWRKCIS